MTTPTITGSGVAGDGVTLFDGTTAVGTGIVSGGGTWSITTGALAAGTHSLTATESDAGVVSAASAVLAITIDTALPVTTPQSLSVAGNSPATPIGIAAPTDADFAAAALAVPPPGLPTDGTVMLADGATPLTQGETLTAAQLANLQFQPTPNLFGTHSTFTYEVTGPCRQQRLGQREPRDRRSRAFAAPTTPFGLALSPGSDSGVQDDDITNVTTPTIIGSGIAGDSVTLFDGANAVGTGTVGGGGDMVHHHQHAGGGHALADRDGERGRRCQRRLGSLDDHDRYRAAGDDIAIHQRRRQQPRHGNRYRGTDRRRFRRLGPGRHDNRAADGRDRHAGGWRHPADPRRGVDGGAASEPPVPANPERLQHQLHLYLRSRPTLPATPRPWQRRSGDPEPARGTLGADLGAVFDKVQDDDITKVTTPTITGTGIAGDSVTLFDGTSVWSGPGPWAAAGPGRLPPARWRRGCTR